MAPPNLRSGDGTSVGDPRVCGGGGGTQASRGGSQASGFPACSAPAPSLCWDRTQASGAGGTMTQASGLPAKHRLGRGLGPPPGLPGQRLPPTPSAQGPRSLGDPPSHPDSPPGPPTHHVPPSDFPPGTMDGDGDGDGPPPSSPFFGGGGGGGVPWPGEPPPILLPWQRGRPDAGVPGSPKFSADRAVGGSWGVPGLGNGAVGRGGGRPGCLGSPGHPGSPSGASSAPDGSN